MSVYERNTSQENRKCISTRNSVHSLVKNGLFWELDRVQGALLVHVINLVSQRHSGAIMSIVMERTESGDIFDGSWPNQLDAVPALDPAIIEQLGRQFHFLLSFPHEAFKGGNSVILTRRAILTDLAASLCSTRLPYPILEARTACRLFASRFAHDTKSVFIDYVSALIFKCY